MATPAYVSEAQLRSVIGANADAERVTVAVDAANDAIAGWTTATDPDTGATAPAPVGPITTQAALELAQTLYRRQAATGGYVDTVDLIARLPADLVRPIRDLLDAVTPGADLGLA